MNNRYLIPRLQVLTTLLVLLVATRILDQSFNHLALDLELVTESEAGSVQDPARVNLLLKLSVAPADFSAGWLR